MSRVRSARAAETTPRLAQGHITTIGAPKILEGDNG